MNIRVIRKEEMSAALDLVWRTFLQFEAPDYTKEGIMEFKRSIDDEEWVASRDFFGAFENDALLGVIATKEFQHISLLFVEGKHHRKGIGKQLFLHVCELNTTGTYTVNSSPYAKVFYERLGFEYTAIEQSVNGLRFYPMRNNNILDYKNNQNSMFL